MPLPAENVSADLINLLKDRFEIADSVDEAGHFTDDPSEIKVFSFNFVNKNGEDKGSVVISLLDDSESSNSLKIYFGQDLGNPDSETRNEWYAFLQDIRRFAKMHLLGFDVRNINKSQITRRDVEKDLKLVTEDILPMFEGTFLPIDGTAKTSHQKLDGEPIKIVIKHTTKVDPEIRGSRSRRIARIYLVNAKNERFLLPFKNLVAARAMARHIENGGTPYDNVGRDICQLVEEMVSLNKFYNKQKKSEAASKPYVSSILAAVRERYLDIKKSLASLSSKGGYAKNSPSLAGNAGELEADDEVFEDAFDGDSLDEESQLALPHVMRAYRSHGKVQEQDEFEKWVNAAKGQGEGQDIIMDAGVEETPEQFTGEKCVSCAGEGCDICNYSGNRARNAQEEAGEMAGAQDIAMLNKQKADEEDYQPFEYGGMNGSIPTSDEIRGTGQMNLESEMSRLKSIVEAHDKEEKWNKTSTCSVCGNSVVSSYNRPAWRHSEETSLQNHKPKPVLNKTNESILKESYDCSCCDDGGSPNKFCLHCNGTGYTDEKDELTPEEKRALELGQEDYNWTPLDDNNQDEHNWVSGDDSEQVHEAKKPKKEKIQSSSSKFDRNDKQLSHAERLALTSPNPMKESKGIIDDLLKESGLMEADVPSSSGWSGPLTWVNTKLGTKFRKPAEIKKHENFSGKLSPFSLLSTKEQDIDDSGKEVPMLQPRGVRSISLPNNASGIDSMSQW